MMARSTASSRRPSPPPRRRRRAPPAGGWRPDRAHRARRGRRARGPPRKRAGTATHRTADGGVVVAAAERAHRPSRGERRGDDVAEGPADALAAEEHELRVRLADLLGQDGREQQQHRRVRREIARRQLGLARVRARRRVVWLKEAPSCGRSAGRRPRPRPRTSSRAAALAQQLEQDDLEVQVRGRLAAAAAARPPPHGVSGESRSLWRATSASAARGVPVGVDELGAEQGAQLALAARRDVEGAGTICSSAASRLRASALEVTGGGLRRAGRRRVERRVRSGARRRIGRRAAGRRGATGGASGYQSSGATRPRGQAARRASRAKGRRRRRSATDAPTAWRRVPAPEKRRRWRARARRRAAPSRRRGSATAACQAEQAGGVGVAVADRLEGGGTPSAAAAPRRSSPRARSRGRPTPRASAPPGRPTAGRRARLGSRASSTAAAAPSARAAAASRASPSPAAPRRKAWPSARRRRRRAASSRLYSAATSAGVMRAAVGRRRRRGGVEALLGEPASKGSAPAIAAKCIAPYPLLVERAESTEGCAVASSCASTSARLHRLQKVLPPRRVLGARQHLGHRCAWIAATAASAARAVSPAALNAAFTAPSRHTSRSSATPFAT